MTKDKKAAASQRKAQAAATKKSNSPKVWKVRATHPRIKRLKEIKEAADIQTAQLRQQLMGISERFQGMLDENIFQLREELKIPEGVRVRFDLEAGTFVEQKEEEDESKPEGSGTDDEGKSS
jgi:LPS O-antigen subunit length determinant protein (WzzB/FepE family)